MRQRLRSCLCGGATCALTHTRRPLLKLYVTYRESQLQLGGRRVWASLMCGVLCLPAWLTPPFLSTAPETPPRPPIKVTPPKLTPALCPLPPPPPALARAVIESYEELIESRVQLSFFLPLIIGHGGNQGSQVVSALIR